MLSVLTYATSYAPFLYQYCINDTRLIWEQSNDFSETQRLLGEPIVGQLPNLKSIFRKIFFSFKLTSFGVSNVSNNFCVFFFSFFEMDSDLLQKDEVRVIDSSELILQNLIGSGAYGQVYKATWKSFVVAVKQVWILFLSWIFFFLNFFLSSIFFSQFFSSIFSIFFLNFFLHLRLNFFFRMRKVSPFWWRFGPSKGSSEFRERNLLYVVNELDGVKSNLTSSFKINNKAN